MRVMGPETLDPRLSEFLNDVVLWTPLFQACPLMCAWHQQDL